MEICAYGKHGCVSFSEALDRFENPELARDECGRLASYGSPESTWWAGQKLHDIDNRNRLDSICRELGWRATEICATHSSRSDIYVQPKTPQIYRPKQPASVIKQVKNRGCPTDTAIMTQDNLFELNKMLELDALNANQSDYEHDRPKQVA